MPRKGHFRLALGGVRTHGFDQASDQWKDDAGRPKGGPEGMTIRPRRIVTIPPSAMIGYS